VKVRGTAAHVAEKYMSLARDAQSAGDIVAAENYLQHAEHYNRIVMAAQAQYQQSQQPQYRDGPDEGYDDERPTNGRFRDRYEYNGDGGREEEGDEQPFEAGDEGGEERTYQPRPPRPDYRQQQSQQQRGPRPDRYDYRNQSGYDRGERDDRQQRSDRGERQERYDRPERGNGPEQEGRPESYSQPENGPEQSAQPAVMEPAGEAPSAEQPTPAPEAQPSSSRRRRGRPPRTEASGASEPESQDMTRDGEAALAAFPE
jgi:hypothetical protein